MKRILLAICALGMIFSAQAQRVYINPGHGDWGSESRNMATVTHAVGDTTGFWESNTNLWKGFALNEKLRAAGFSTLMSRTENSSPLVLVYAIFPFATCGKIAIWLFSTSTWLLPSKV